MTDAAVHRRAGAGLVSIVRAIATDLLDRKDELNRLDAVAGDGDLGLTMTAAANALLELAPSLESLAGGGRDPPLRHGDRPEGAVDRRNAHSLRAHGRRKGGRRA